MPDQPPHEWGKARAQSSQPEPPKPSAPPPPEPEIRRPPRPPRPTRSRPRVWPWVTGLIVVLMAVMAGCVTLVVSIVREPVGAANEFVALLDDGEYAEAYDMLCDDTQQAVSLEQFRSQVAVPGDITAYGLVSASAGIGELTLVSGTIEIDDEPRHVTFRLSKESDEWRVCSYDVLVE